MSGWWRKARTQQSIRPFVCLILIFALTSCSYSYDLLAVMIDGRLAFVVAPKFPSSPDCINRITVGTVDDSIRAIAEPGDDNAEVGYGTFWSEDVSYTCETNFPVFYGQPLKGKPTENDRVDRHVNPKALRRGIVYRVNTTTGATGYGDGIFMIERDGSVRNISRDKFDRTVEKPEQAARK